MSDNEQDAAIGRIVKDLSENKRKLAAMTSELERYEKAFKLIAQGLGHNDVAADFNLKVTQQYIASNSVLESLDLKPLVSFLEEYTQIRQSVDTGAARLRGLGV